MTSLIPPLGLVLLASGAALAIWVLVRPRFGSKAAGLAAGNAAAFCLLVVLVVLAISREEQSSRAAIQQAVPKLPTAQQTAPPAPEARETPPATSQPEPEDPGPETSAPQPAATQAADEDRRWHVVASMLNLRRGPGREYPATGKLDRFDTVRVSGRAEKGWVPVTSDVGVGYVAGQYLRKGPGKDAFMALCRLSERARPATGTILEARHDGPHTLAITNDGTRDAVLKLRNDVGAVIMAVYLRAGENTEVRGITSGDYIVKVARGRDFSPNCNIFTESLSIRRAPGRISLHARETDGQVVGGTFDINIDAFFTSDDARQVAPLDF